MKIILASPAIQAMQTYLRVRDQYLSEGKNPAHFPEYLLSYWYCFGNQARSGDRAMQEFRDHNYGNLVMDSGVFTARKKNIIIPEQQLAQYWARHNDVISGVFGMDSGPIEEQLAKTRALHALGVPVIPIYHASMPLDYIERFMELSNFIAIAGYEVGGNSAQGSNKYFSTIFNYIHRRGLWPLKLHLLGCEMPETLKQFPFYSADSSTFASETIFMWTRKWNPLTHRLDTVSLDGRTISGKDQDFCRVAYPSYIERYEYAIRQRILMQEFLTNWWTTRGITFDE